VVEGVCGEGYSWDCIECNDFRGKFLLVRGFDCMVWTTDEGTMGLDLEGGREEGGVAMVSWWFGRTWGTDWETSGHG